MMKRLFLLALALPFFLSTQQAQSAPACGANGERCMFLNDVHQKSTTRVAYWVKSKYAVKGKTKYVRVLSARQNPRAQVVDANSNEAKTVANGGFYSNSLINEARRYIGTNPTGRGSLWCGAFMDLVLKKTGHVGGGNLASAYARYGTRVAGPTVGAIAVMGRRGGGHVGVVTGIDANGNPIIISGNTWNRSTGGRHTVAEGVYPRHRVYAYVLPGG